MFELDYHIYTINDIDKLLIEDVKTIKTNKGGEYLNVPATVDIESSSFYDVRGEKTAIMYSFVIGINGRGIIGRTYEDLLTICKKLVNFYELSKNRRLILYVHNLEYEFQFFRK